MQSSSSLFRVSLIFWNRGWLTFGIYSRSGVWLGCDSFPPIFFTLSYMIISMTILTIISIFHFRIIILISKSNFQPRTFIQWNSSILIWSRIWQINIFVLSKQTWTIYIILIDIKIKMNPYEVLQLPQTATYQQIKQRYRHLSKMVHPDKHPIENYQIAQAHFKQIDQAYKSISSDLRRYVYKHYGSTGITIVQNNHFLFQEFEKADLDDPVILNKLNQVMMYCLYEQYASNQIDKNSLGNKSVLLICKPINDTNQLPSVDRFQFSFETSLPDYLGMSHTASITHESEGLNSQTKSGMSYGIGSSKRITQTLMFSAQTHITSQKLAIQAGVDKNINNNLVLHFIPVNFVNGELGGMQVGADFQRDSFYISSITDLRDFTVQIGSNPANKQVSKSIKMAFNGEEFMFYPSYEREVTSRLRMFFQLHLKGDQPEFTGQNQTSVKLSMGLAYGYKLKLMDELKLELVSYINPSQSNFQISIITPKFKTTIPIFSRSDMIRYEIFKLGAFVGIYLSFQLYNYYIRKSERRRKRIEFENYNRLSVEKNVVSKNNGDYYLAAAQSRQRQVKYTGLVVLLSYLGSANSIGSLKMKIKRKFTIGKNKEKLADLIENAKKFIQETRTNQDDFAEELYQITQSVQSNVQGSQLLGYNVEELRVNPCMDEKDPYYSLTLVYLRSQIIILEKKSSELIAAGNLNKKYKKPWYQALIDAFKTKMIN